MQFNRDRMIGLAAQGPMIATLALVLLALQAEAPPTRAASPTDADKPAKAKAAPAKPASVKLGLIQSGPKAFPGYTVISPMNAKKTYLIDLQGKVVHTWESKYGVALSPYLLENGHLLRPASLQGEEKSFGGGPGASGRVQEFTWEGDLLWDFKLFNKKQLPHHDITHLPNGNVLMIVWDKKTAKEAIAAGRRPDMVGESHLLPDSLIEIQQTGKTTGKVVWEWHLWDHLVQDHDKSKANYGNVAAHPELVNINYGEDALAPIVSTKGGADKLKSIGYVGSNTGKGRRGANPDWTHFNGVAYNAELDQVVVSVHGFSELWIIDHSTTTTEAAGHKGGRAGKGGDLLYRWGNPWVYGAGTKKNQTLFAQHNAHWIAPGLPGAGHLLVFNNGMRRPDGSYSSVDELILPVDSRGRYTHQSGTPYGPDKPAWSYTAAKKTDFFSMLISGAQRLPNGNTLICSGINGTIFEVTPAKEIVWKYVNPAKGGPMPGPGGFGPPPGPGGGFRGPPPFGGPLPSGQLLPRFLQNMLQLTADQKKQMTELQKKVDNKLAKTLTEAQRKQFKENKTGFGGAPQPGQIMSPFQQARLKLTAEQKKELQALQKEADTQLDQVLKSKQKKQLKDMRAGFGRGGFRFGPGGPGGFPGFGPPGGSSLFRALRYAMNYPGLAGKTLTPGKTIEELEKKKAK